MDFDFYPNLYFEAAIRELARHHRVFELVGRPALDMTKKPSPYLKSQGDWAYYMNAVVTVLTIGKREDWIQMHQDGAGRTLFWRLLEPKA